MFHRSVVLYIAMSLDGYIADEQGGIDFLSVVQRPPEDYGYGDFVKSIDTVIMGRKTYDMVRSFDVPFPHAGRRCIVLSRSRQGRDENVEFFGGDVPALIAQLKREPGADIFIDGGAETVAALMAKNLIDRYIISIVPVLLGSGISLFAAGRSAQELTLLRTTTFPTGLVQLWYEKK